MIIEEIKKIKSEKSDLRKFGLTIGIFLVLLGLFLIWRGKGWYIYPIIIGTIFILGGIIWPSLLKVVHKIWMTFGIVMGHIMTHLILIVLYYLILTSVALIAKLFRADLLGLSFDKNAKDSYWIPREKTVFKKEDYERQF